SGDQSESAEGGRPRGLLAGLGPGCEAAGPHSRPNVFVTQLRPARWPCYDQLQRGDADGPQAGRRAVRTVQGIMSLRSIRSAKSGWMAPARLLALALALMPLGACSLFGTDKDTVNIRDDPA